MDMDTLGRMASGDKVDVMRGLIVDKVCGGLIPSTSDPRTVKSVGC